MAAKPSHDTLIHCEACGEDYSATYRRCPFCGARNDPRRVTPRNDPASSGRYIPTPPPAQPSRRDREEELDDTYIFDGQDAFDEDLEEEYYAPRPKGGKRLAPKEGGSFELPPINWPRLITFLCSLVIIVAALVIVFTVIYPQLRTNKDPDAAGSAGISAPPSGDPGPGQSAGALPSPDPALTDEPIQGTEPVDPVTPPPTVPVTQPPVGTRATVVNASSGLRVRSGPGTTYTVVDSLYNGDPIDVIGPAGSGWYNISYTGRNGNTVTGCIMGDYISTIAGTTTTTTPPPATQPPVISTQAPSTGGGPTVGRAGTIVNADGGLRVRPDPSTSNPPIATLFNGNAVQVVADAGGGWYQITFSGEGGAATPGYIMGEYISTN